MRRVILIVLDSVGAGALPDAAEFGDSGANTLGHIYEKTGVSLPCLQAMGLGRLNNIGFPDTECVFGAYGRAIEKSKGKDTTTGHWEITGLQLENPFPVFPNGFPNEFIRSFSNAIGTEVLGNYPASGTAILDELGEEHIRSGKPIVYTSADSVFQIAAHEKIIPLQKLYGICETAREMLTGDLAVGRVIARPFIGEKAGQFKRTSGRRDFSLKPFSATVLDLLKNNGKEVCAVGKIEDIFAMQGITQSIHAAGNPACIEATYHFLRQDFEGLLFVNLVDFDMIYGHRRDTEGYAAALSAFDKEIPVIQSLMGKDDLLIITADHGCDPTYKGTDHTREYIPILAWSPRLKKGIPLGTRDTYADIAATISEAFGFSERFHASSFLKLLEESS